VQRYAYNASGNMTQRDKDGDGTYDQAPTFNAENKVERVMEGGEETTFTYDGNTSRARARETRAGEKGGPQRHYACPELALSVTEGRSRGGQHQAPRFAVEERREVRRT
jgi:hypothetical protein